MKNNTRFSKGDHVKVSPSNDNDCYDSFRNKILVVTHVATNTNEHPGYDTGLTGEALYDFKTLDGKEIPCSLYDYELIPA